MRFLDITYRVRRSTFNPDNVGRFCKGELERTAKAVGTKPGMVVTNTAPPQKKDLGRRW